MSKHYIVEKFCESDEETQWYDVNGPNFTKLYPTIAIANEASELFESIYMQGYQDAIEKIKIEVMKELTK